MTKAEDLISLEFWKTHRDFDDYIPLLVEHLILNKDRYTPVDTKGHTTNGTWQWNNIFHPNTQEYERRDLMYKLHLSYFIALDYLDKNADLENTYTHFINYLNNGYIADEKHRVLVDMQREHNQSYQTGQSIKMFFTKPFSPEARVFKNMGWHLLDPAPTIKPYELTLKCESGTLIAADWIRIPTYTKAIKLKDEHAEKYSWNNMSGRVESAKEKANIFNLADISLGNTRVDIYKKGNQLVFGSGYSYNRDTDTEKEVKPTGFKEVGSICTDRWSLNLIDRTQLEHILAENGDTNPAQTVDNYIKEENPEIIKVKPGTYHLYFNGQYNKFTEQFSSPDFEKTPGFNYYVIISDKQLTLEEVLEESIPSPDF